ncbi:cyclodeaminase/cyclohydrolase family protein [Stutzerimonas urumqiensis]|uniref:cyclodeaminase/cyclohydrolase family protein n=1 Tax=Stutzerimonas urumqiensis TaxID=638269 RepID=UPI003DA295AF
MTDSNPWHSRLRTYLDETAAARPTPGCGPAAATTIALGLALVIKGLRIARPQDLPASDERALQAPQRLVREAEGLLDRLQVLAEADMQAFAQYLRARRATDSPAIEDSARQACAVPLATAHCGLEGLALALAAWPHTSTALRSDTLAGGVLLHAGIEAALINVEADMAVLDEPDEQALAGNARDHARRQADTALAQLRQLAASR